MAYAELGDFARAVEWQRGLVTQMRNLRNEPMAQHLEENLRKYLRREPVRIKQP